MTLSLQGHQGASQVMGAVTHQLAIEILETECSRHGCALQHKTRPHQPIAHTPAPSPTALAPSAHLATALAAAHSAIRCEPGITEMGVEQWQPPVHALLEEQQQVGQGGEASSGLRALHDAPGACPPSPIRLQPLPAPHCHICHRTRPWPHTATGGSYTALGALHEGEEGCAVRRTGCAVNGCSSRFEH